MSDMPLKPASTRLEIGQETKPDSRSTSRTSMFGSHKRMYLAAVAPPKPAPITTTRPRAGRVVAQPVADSAAVDTENFRKSRRRIVFMVVPSALLRGEPRRKRVDL